MTEEIGFSKYGKGFQESLAQLILDDRPFADQMEEVMDVNFFEFKYLRTFINLIYNYRQRYDVHPSKKIMSTVLRADLDDENDTICKQVRDYFSRICFRELSDIEYVKQTSLDFCKKQKLKEAMIKSVDLLQASSYDEIESIITKALRLGTDGNYGHDYKKDFESRYILKARNPVSTGWKEIDSISKDGLGKGELGVVIAPTGAGKSMVLAHLGSQALKDGKNVVHYTLELSSERTGQRYDSCISGVHLSELYDRKEAVYESCVDVKGELIIKEYPTKSATVSTLRSHLEKLKKNDRKIDMILVDYADLLHAPTKYREKREELESIYEGLRALSQEFECPVWTASQTNRSGLNAEVITMESISEAFNKCFVADFIFSISRTIDDKKVNGGRLFIAKNRNGPDGLIYPIFMNTSNVKIEVLTQTQDTIEDLNLKAAKRERQKVKDFYKKFVNGEETKNAATK
tara:strand:- start:750 stop:2132 length:1383 start_codon:yes stop_codon:yes gene_type:complete